MARAIRVFVILIRGWFVPAEVRELGRVLQRIMIGDKNVDLSSLPKEWAEAVRKAMEE